MGHTTSLSQLLGRTLMYTICDERLRQAGGSCGSRRDDGSKGAPLPYISMVLAIAIELGGGLLMLFGLLTRPAAVVLGPWCIATAIIAYRNWVRFDMKAHFLKNLAMADGFVCISAFGAGAISPNALPFHGRPAAGD